MSLYYVLRVESFDPIKIEGRTYRIPTNLPHISPINTEVFIPAGDAFHVRVLDYEHFNRYEREIGNYKLGEFHMMLGDPDMTRIGIGVFISDPTEIWADLEKQGWEIIKKD